MDKEFQFQCFSVSACFYLFVFCLKVHESLQAVSTESQDSSDPELRWLQKTQQLRVGPWFYFSPGICQI